MFKRYLPYALLYVLGVVSAWGVFQFTHSSADPTQTASVSKQPARSGIRSAKSRTPVTAVPRIAKKARADSGDVPARTRINPDKTQIIAEKQPARKSKASSAMLREAVAKGDQHTVKRLLKTRKVLGKRGHALLMTAVENGHSDVARQLIKAGADIDVRSPAGDTPLMVAARSGDPVIVHMLLEGGADIGARSRRGKTAQAIAKSSGHDVVYEFITDEVGRRGKQTGMVAEAQGLLNKLGYKLGSADGVAGPRTVRAVRRFQKSHKIRVDGKITPALISALQRKKARRATNKSLASRSTSGARSTAKLEPKTRVTDAKGGKSEDDSAQSGDKGWFSRASSSVSGFLKATQEATSERAQLCEAAQDRWVQNSSGGWIECTNVPQY